MTGLTITSGAASGVWRRALVFCVVLLLSSAAHALDATTARQHVDATIDDIVQLMVEAPDPSEVADRLLQIVERRASVDQVARFAAGRYWRTMSASERAEFTRAFTHYLRRSTPTTSGASRAASTSCASRCASAAPRMPAEGIGRPHRDPSAGRPPIAVDWLVSDRSGRSRSPT